MFNALNRIISRLDGDAPSTPKDNHGAFGFQVLRNETLELAVEPWFDFVVGINGRMIVCSASLQQPECRDLIGSPSSRTTRTRGYSPRKSGTALAAL